MTRNSPIALSTPDTVLSAAAEWFDRLQHEELAPEDVAAWQHWLAQNPAHRIAFDRLQDVWQSLEAVPPPLLASKQQRAADEYRGDVSVAQWRARTPRPAVTIARRWRYAAAILLFVAVGGAGVWSLWTLHHSPTVSVFETAAAEHREVRLPDGSIVSLGAKSLAWIHFESDLREVTLDRGEAFFQVAQDKKRPFIVRAGDASITAIGTAFNVRRTGSRVLVAVTEGVVKVASGPQETDVQTVAPQRHSTQTRLSAGHQLIMDPASSAPAVSSASPQTATAWRAGRLEYIDEPLKYVVADVNRYSQAEILVANPALGELRVTGTVFENDIDGWLQSLEKFLPVRVARLPQGGVRLENPD